LAGGRKAVGEMAKHVTRDSMNDIVFHGKYEDMKPMPVSSHYFVHGQKTSGPYNPSRNAPFANAHNTPPTDGWNGR
jgi:hypothetical protein